MNNGTSHDLPRIRSEVASLCAGMEPRTALAAVALHAHILNLSRGAGWPRGEVWYKHAARAAVRAADAVLAEMRSEE